MNLLLNKFEELKKNLPTDCWFSSQREEAYLSFNKRGMPKPSDEEWLHLKLPVLNDEYFRPENSEIDTKLDLPSLTLKNSDAVTVYLINGKLSKIEGVLPAEVTLLSFDQAVKEKVDLIKSKLTVHTNGDNPLFELNTALQCGGVFIHIPRGIKTKIHLVHCAQTNSIFENSRFLILVDEGANLELTETLIGDSHEYWLNQVSEIYLNVQSQIQHVLVQNQGKNIVNTKTTLVHQETGSNYESFIADLGAQLARHQVQVFLNKEGANASVKGFAWLNGTRQVDHNIRIDHVSGHCSSQTEFKTVLDDSSRGIFRGLAVVHPNAHKTSAAQSSKNILLSKNAEADPKPQLEIYHDDVKCSHGATVGQLDEEALFYLCSRGLSSEQAKHLLTRAFLQELIESVPLASVKSYMESCLDALMPDTTRGDL